MNTARWRYPQRQTTAVIIGGGQAAEGVAFDPPGQLVLGQDRPDELGVGATRGDDVDRHIVPGDLHRQRLGKTDQRRLGAGVDGFLGGTDPARVRADQHDPPVLVPAHVGQEDPADVQGAAEVHVDDALLLFHARFEEPPVGPPPGVAHQLADRPAGRVDPLRRRLSLTRWRRSMCLRLRWALTRTFPRRLRRRTPRPPPLWTLTRTSRRPRRRTTRRRP